MNASLMTDNMICSHWNELVQ